MNSYIISRKCIEKVRVKYSVDLRYLLRSENFTYDCLNFCYHRVQCNKLLKNRASTSNISSNLSSLLPLRWNLLPLSKCLAFRSNEATWGLKAVSKPLVAQDIFTPIGHFLIRLISSKG